MLPAHHQPSRPGNRRLGNVTAQSKRQAGSAASHSCNDARELRDVPMEFGIVNQA